MTLNKYQEKAKETAIYSDKYRILYPALKLASEAGEVAGKVGKSLRDNNGIFDDRALAQEIGDVLWYCAALATDLGLDLDGIACLNLNKLRDRQRRNKLGGSGDDR